MASRFQFLVLLLLAPTLAWGFINVESVRLGHSAGFSGKSKAQIDGRKGNTDKIIAQVGSTNSYKFGENELLGLFNYQYGETTKVRDTNRGSLHGRYTRRWWEAGWGELFLQRQFDDFQNLIRRDLLGVGLRWQLIQREKNYLYLGTGAFHESERLKNEPNNSDIRGNFYLSYFLKIRDDFELSSVFYYQPKADELKDFRIQLKGGFEYKLFSMFSLINELSVAHDSRPPGQVELTDIIYTFGFLVNY